MVFIQDLLFAQPHDHLLEHAADFLSAERAVHFSSSNNGAVAHRLVGFRNGEDMRRALP